jgi:hypothetical protein
MPTIPDIIALGTIAYDLRYMETMVSYEVARHEIAPPKALVTLAAKHGPAATAVTFGDGSHGIDIGGRTWAHPMAAQSPEYGARVELGQDVWQYIGLALSILGLEPNHCRAERAHAA